MPGVSSTPRSAAPSVNFVGQVDKGNYSQGDLVVRWLRTSAFVVFIFATMSLAYHYLMGGSNASGATSGAMSLLAEKGDITGLGTLPKGDDRKYQYTVLPNGLSVVNVQDKRAMQKAMAVAVEAGSYDDPASLPGLAHFCEHMLFLGTKGYPEASGFDSFMSAHGGRNNAYTADEVTVYFAEVSQAAGKEGMDRFADFFRAPLFDEKYVAREVNAIDSEHAKNKQDATRRILQVAYSLANPKSPVSAFHTGNKQTLYEGPKSKGVNPVDGLKVYFKSHYCPGKMHLVTYGSDSLAQQLREASKEFGNITARDSSCQSAKHSFAKPEPWGPERMGRLALVQGTLPESELWLQFALPDVSKEFRSQPLNYLEYVLSYSGENSLRRMLQDDLGLATSLQPMFDQSSAGTNLFVVMHLTKAGESQLELVMSAVYAYFATLRKQGVNEKLYDSLARISKLDWDWAEPAGPSDTASDLAERMTRLPAKSLLSGESLIEKPNSALVKSLIDRLTPGNMNVIYVDSSSKNRSSSSFLHLHANRLKTLPYYDVQYSVGEFAKVLPKARKRWDSWLKTGVIPQSVTSLVGSKLPDDVSASGTLLAIPPKPIEGVPRDIPLDHMHAAKGRGGRDLELYGVRPRKVMGSAAPAFLAMSKRHPALLDAKRVEVWYRSGWVTTSPKAQLQLAFRPLRKSGEKEGSASEELRLVLFNRLLSEAMAPSMVDLTATGVSYDISVSPSGLSFSFGGFTPLMSRLISKTLQKFNSFNGDADATSPARFQRVTEEIRQKLKAYPDMPVQYAIQDRNTLMQRGTYSRGETLKALDKLTKGSAVSSVNDVLLSKPLTLTSLAMGNIGEKEANKAILEIAAGLKMPRDGGISAKSNGELEYITPVVKIPNPVEIRRKNPRAGDPNDAVVLSLVAGVATVRSRVLLGLLGQVLSHVAYSELRTRRQLGYVVSAGASMVSNVHYVSCVVQGIALKADEVEAAIEWVMTHQMPKVLKNLSEKEFNAYKDSMHQELLQPPLRFQDEASHFWGPVSQGGQCFDLRDSMLQFLTDSVKTKDDLVDEWARLATPAQGLRSKIVVKYFAGDVPKRPSEAQAVATWEKQGVAKSAVPLLRQEHKNTLVFDRADSEVRKQLAKKGGYFPRTINCRVGEQQKGPGMPPPVRHAKQALRQRALQPQ